MIWDSNFLRFLLRCFINQVYLTLMIVRIALGKFQQYCTEETPQTDKISEIAAKDENLMAESNGKMVTWLDEEEVAFTWVIKNFENFAMFYEIKSEKFESNYEDWAIFLRANEIHNDVSYTLEWTSTRKNNIMRNTGTNFNIPRVQFKVLSSKVNRQIKLGKNSPYCAYSFILKSDLENTENGFLDDGDLKIFLQIFSPMDVHHAVQKPDPLVGNAILSSNMKQLLTCGAEADITIATATKSFAAHKIIMKNSSPVFQKMLETKMLESETNVIKIEDFEEDAVGAMLSYIYTGTVDNFSENALELLKLSEKYALDGLKKDSETTLINNLKTENAFEYFQAARLFNSKMLELVVRQFMYWNRMEEPK